MTDIKAIETRYAGYRFRSRLEARWAVFFDALGLTWEYEPEGFETDAGWYLPDFRLVSGGPHPYTYWAEVKPQKLNETEREKAFALSSITNMKVIELNQIPNPHDLGNYMTWCKVRFHVGSKMKDAATDWYFAEYLIKFYEDQTLITRGSGNLSDALKWDMDYFRNRHGKEHGSHFLNGLITEWEFPSGTLNISRACVAARSARFEHGETP